MSVILERARDVLLKQKTFVLPEVDLCFYSGKSPILLTPPQRMPVETVTLRVDTLVLTSGKKQLVLAVNPGEHTEERLINGDESALSVLLDPGAPDFEEALLNDTTCKSWLYNAYAHKVYRRFLEAADALTVTIEGARRHVANCPREVRIYRGKPYANLDIDCNACEYCIDSSEENVLLCTGRKRLALPEDFGRPYHERSLPHAELAYPQKTEMVKSGYCPKCGAPLLEKRGAKGKFLGCSGYPFCHFTAEKTESGDYSFYWIE